MYSIFFFLCVDSVYCIVNCTAVDPIYFQNDIPVLVVCVNTRTSLDILHAASVIATQTHFNSCFVYMCERVIGCDILTTNISIHAACNISILRRNAGRHILDDTGRRSFYLQRVWAISIGMELFSSFRYVLKDYYIPACNGHKTELVKIIY